MKVQVHHNEIRQLITQGYDKVYNQLQSILQPEEFIFAKWEAGFGDVHQWTLPADRQWYRLTEADMYDRNAVITAYLSIHGAGAAKLMTGRTGEALRKFVEDVYTVPSEDYVFYTIDENGRYRVMLTGWGHAFPTRPGLSPGFIGSQSRSNQPVTVKFTENGVPMAGLTFDIVRRDGRRIPNYADQDGEKYIDALQPGTELKLALPTLGKEITLIVMAGKALYQFELGEKPKVEIPKIEEPTPVPGPIPKPEELRRNRDIAIRFINVDGRPVTGAEAIFSQEGKPTLAEGLDDTGSIYLDNSDFIMKTPLRIELNTGRPNVTFEPVTIALEPEHNEYQITFRLVSRSKIWPTILLIAGGVLATAGAWMLFQSLSKII